MKTFLSLMICIILATTAAAAPEVGPGVPDLTKGGELTRMNERWVGPVGIHCGYWRPRHRTDEQQHVKQLLVQEVVAGSPAEGVLSVGDVILGADGTGAAKVPLFESASVTLIPISQAITEAEARNPALLRLLIWRPDKNDQADGGVPQGKTQTVTIKLESLGRYSETAPYNCPKSKNILRKGIKALYEEDKLDKAGLGILCLLAADDPTNPDNEKYQAKAKEWAHQLEVDAGPWFTGPQLMALSEYYMKTGDKTILPKLEALAETVATGLSWFGTCGHRWSEPAPDGSANGRIAGYGSIAASGALNYLGLSLARKAGVTSDAIEKSHKAQRAFFGHYAFKSGIGYGEHPYGIRGVVHDYNGKLANSGLALGMDEGQEDKAKFFSKAATLSRVGYRLYAHGGSYFGQVFHPLGAVQGGEKAANMKFREYRWHLDLKRRWDHTRIYDASGNGYNDHHHSATALLFYAAPLKQIYLTGRGQKDSLKFTDVELKELDEIKNFDPSRLTIDELLSIMPRYDGMLRGSVAQEISARVKAEPDAPETPATIEKLLAIAANEDNSTHARTGACATLMFIKEKAPGQLRGMKNAEIAKTLIGLLKDEEAYIRFAAIRAMQKLDESALEPHGNEILDAILATDRPTFPLDEENPLRWAHGEMGSLLSDVFRDSLDGLDRDRLIPALRSLLKTPNGGARQSLNRLIRHLSEEETLLVADVLVDNIRNLPPGNAMGGSAAPASQTILAKYMFEEALPLNAKYGFRKGAHAKNIPEKYGKSALQMEAVEEFLQLLGDQILVEAVDAREYLSVVEDGAMPEEDLNQLKRIDNISAANPTLKLPANQTQLVADATNFGVSGENETTYTWRQVHGAGEVSFSPNATGQSKTTTVTFTDKKPGIYRFELEMSDTLGLNTLRKSVDVTLHDASGKLPSNQPPRAKSQVVQAIPGKPSPVRLSGSDPDGDKLGFVVTELPANGRLTGVADRRINASSAVDGRLFYTANIGFKGKDRFSFTVFDGQGKSANGTVEFNVSPEGVGVAVYEGFDYPEGKVAGREGGTSFGFAGPWIGSRGEEHTRFNVFRTPHEKASGASISLPGIPSSGGRLGGHKHDSLSRALDPQVLAKHKLLKNGSELWFSFFLDRPSLTFDFTGPELSLGFMAKGPHQYTLHATLNGEIAGESRNRWTRSAHLRYPETEGSMIVGHCKWGKTDKDPDVMTIHRVFNAPKIGPILLEDPVCTLEEAIDQKTLDAINIHIGGSNTLDEIRIGPTRNSVMLGTQPLR